MTWEEWIDSEYNTDGYYIADSLILTAGSNLNRRYSFVYYIFAGAQVESQPSDVIAADTSYHLEAEINNE